MARAVGVHRQSVSRWARKLGAAGLRGLRKAARPGRPAKLSPLQWRALERALRRGPEACGYVIRAPQGRLVMERLPGYAPELNPVEYL